MKIRRQCTGNAGLGAVPGGRTTSRSGSGDDGGDGGGGGVPGDSDDLEGSYGQDYEGSLGDNDRNGTHVDRWYESKTTNARVLASELGNQKPKK